MNKRHNSVLELAIILIIGSVFGWMVGAYLTPMNKTSMTASSGIIPGIGGGPSATKQVSPYNSNIADFRLANDSLFKEHAVTTAEYLKNLYDGKDTSTLLNQLNQNGNLISINTGKIYGSDAQNKFLKMWQDHINEYTNYTKALKSKNTTGQTKAKNNLNAQAKQMGDMMHALDNNFQAATIEQLMKKHVDLTLSIIDAYASKDSAKVATQMKEVYDQAGRFADYISQAIYSSHPDKI